MIIISEISCLPLKRSIIDKVGTKVSFDYTHLHNVNCALCNFVTHLIRKLCLFVQIYACDEQIKCENGVKIRPFFTQNLHNSYPSKIKTSPCINGRRHGAIENHRSRQRVQIPPPIVFSFILVGPKVMTQTSSSLLGQKTSSKKKKIE